MSKPFVKGDPRIRPGRAKGSKNKATIERDRIAYWTAFFSSSRYLDNAEARVLKGRASHIENYWLPRIDGKPAESIEVSGPNHEPIAITFRVVRHETR